MTSAIDAFGTLLKIGDGAENETFTTVAEVTDISGPGFSVDVEDVTSHSSTGAWEEVIPTIIRSGEISFSVNFIPTGATHSQTSGLLADMKAKTNRNFQLVFPDNGSTTWTLSTYIVGFEPSMAVDGVLTADLTLKITGQPTLAG